MRHCTVNNWIRWEREVGQASQNNPSERSSWRRAVSASVSPSWAKMRETICLSTCLMIQSLIKLKSVATFASTSQVASRRKLSKSCFLSTSRQLLKIHLRAIKSLIWPVRTRTHSCCRQTLAVSVIENSLWVPLGGRNGVTMWISRQTSLASRSLKSHSAMNYLVMCTKRTI